MKKTVVVALGGNAITREFEEGNIYQQFANTRKSLTGVTDLIEMGYNIAITHGNGPQVGNYMIRVEETRRKISPVPLGIMVADLEGGMGYMIGQTMINKLKSRKINRPVVTIVTQVLVDPDDPSIKDPSKFVGPFYGEDQLYELEVERGYVIKKDSNRGYRRVVASPKPIAIVEQEIISHLINQETVVISGGGGGIPVYYDDDGNLEGVDGVIDKDLVSALLGIAVKAELLVIMTSVEKVAINFGTSEQIDLDEITVSQAKKYLNNGHFPPGSMGPKIEAAINFLENGGQKVIICSIENTPEAVRGKTGTHIIPG